MVLKIKHSAIAWVYHYGTSYCKLTVKCMDKVVSGCDFDEVLLIDSTTWDPETMSVTTPFVAMTKTPLSAKWKQMDSS